jgi:hypothetical protein
MDWQMNMNTIFWRLNLIVLSVILIAYYSYLFFDTPHPFWDLSVYERAVADFQNGTDPYKKHTGLLFIYNPLALRLFFLLDQISPLRITLLALYGLSFAWIFYELTMLREVNSCSAYNVLEMPSARISRLITAFSAVTIPAMAFGSGIGVTSIASGNLTLYMHLALIAAFLGWGRESDSRKMFVPILLIPIFSIIKPYFLLYLALPLLISDKRKRAFNHAVFAGVVALFFWFGSYYFYAAEYAKFMAALKLQTFGGNDVGYSFFGIFRGLGANDLLALSSHFAVSAILATGALLYIRSEKSFGHQLKLLLLYFIFTIANPRMKEYDLFPALICLFAFLRAVSPRPDLIILIGVLFSSAGYSSYIGNMAELTGVYSDNIGQIIGLLVIGIIFTYQVILRKNPT